MSRHAKLAAVCAVAAFGVVGVAFGAIPGTGGVISACYDKQSGQVRIYDTAGGTPKGCGKTEAAISWNQQGPKGDKGDTGSEGPAGVSGHEIVYEAGTQLVETAGVFGIAEYVDCPEGKVAFGGGGSGVIVRSDGTTGGVADVFSSMPNGPAAWTVVFGNRDGSELKDPFSLEGVRYEIFVVCAATSE